MKPDPANKRKPAPPSAETQQGDQQYRQLTEQLPAITYIVELQPAPRTTYISPQVLPLLGYTQEEWLAETDFWVKQLDPQDRDRVLDLVRQHNESGESFYLEYRVRTKDGRTVWIRNSATYQRNQAGRMIAVHGVMQDVTARKLAEEWLSVLNDHMLNFGNDVAANIDTLVSLCGKTLGATCALYNRLDGGLLTSVGQWQTPPGFEAIDQPEGHICFDVIHEASNQPLVVRNLPVTLYARTDRNVTAYDLKTYIGMAVKCRGQAVGSVCVVYQHDVEPSPEQLDYLRIVSLALAIEEERKATEQVVKHSKQNYKNLYDLFRSMADVIPDLLWAKDMDKQYLFANRALCERVLCAHNTEEPIGRTDLFFARRERMAHPENPDWHTFGEICADSDAIVMRTSETLQVEESGNVRGKYLCLDVIKTPLRNEKGEIIGTVGTGRDITESKKDQGKKPAPEANSQAAEQRVADGKYIGGKAHDLNNILQAVMGNVELALEQVEPDGTVHEDLLEVQSASRRAADLLKQLLAFARKLRAAPGRPA